MLTHIYKKKNIFLEKASQASISYSWALKKVSNNVFLKAEEIKRHSSSRSTRNTGMHHQL